MKKQALILTLLFAAPVLANQPPQTAKEKLVRCMAIILRDTAYSAVAGGLMGMIFSGNIQRLAPPAEGINGNWARQNPIIYGASWGAALGAVLGIGECANEFTD